MWIKLIHGSEGEGIVLFDKRNLDKLGGIPLLDDKRDVRMSGSVVIVEYRVFKRMMDLLPLPRLASLYTELTGNESEYPHGWGGVRKVMSESATRKIIMNQLYIELEETV